MYKKIYIQRTRVIFLYEYGTTRDDRASEE